MRISHKHKFVYIAIPKTGSTSVRFALTNYYDIKSVECKNSPYFHHVTADVLKKHFDEKKWNWDDYFKFSFVRNPWEREVSNYEYKRKSKYIWEKYKEGNENHYQECCELLEKYPTFKSLVMSTEITYDRFYIDDNNNDLLDFVGRCEDMQVNLDYICNKLQIPKINLPHKNKSEHKHYSEYYDEESKKYIENLYSYAIERFGYKFIKQ